MKAAEGLAERGHEVTLVEREERLGGQLNINILQRGRGSWEVLREDLGASIVRLGVDVRLGVTADAAFVEGFEADGVVLATGAIPDSTGWSTVSTTLPGADLPHVMTLWDAIRQPERAGRRVVLLDDEGAFRIGGAALRLQEAGAEVILVSRLNALLPSTLVTTDMPPLYAALFGNGLDLRLNSWARRITSSSVTIFNLYSGAEEEIGDVDSVVLGTARHPDEALYCELSGRLPVLHRIGDCLVPRTTDHAVYEGFLAGREMLGWTERPLFEGDRNPRSPNGVVAER